MNRKQITETITKDYKEHVATYKKIEQDKAPIIEHMTWGKPGTCVGYVVYMTIGNSLIVRGDYGEAIYTVTDSQPLRFWANTGLSYMKEKCRASEGGYGSKWNDWSEEECIDRIDEAIREHNDGGETEHPELLEEFKGAACTQQDWEMYLMRNDYELAKLLGECWHDYGPWSWGEVPPVRLHCHHIGLKLAWAQVKDEV